MEAQLLNISRNLGRYYRLDSYCWQTLLGEIQFEKLGECIYSYVFSLLAKENRLLDGSDYLLGLCLYCWWRDAVLSIICGYMGLFVCRLRWDPSTAVYCYRAGFAEVGGTRKASGRLNSYLEGGFNMVLPFVNGLNLRRNIPLIYTI